MKPIKCDREIVSNCASLQKIYIDKRHLSEEFRTPLFSIGGHITEDGGKTWWGVRVKHWGVERWCLLPCGENYILSPSRYRGTSDQEGVFMYDYHSNKLYQIPLISGIDSSSLGEKCWLTGELENKDGFESVDVEITNNGKRWVVLSRKVQYRNKRYKVFLDAVFRAGKSSIIANATLRDELDETATEDGIAKSDDFGQSWNLIGVFSFRLQESINDVGFIDDKSGWIVTDWHVYATFDGGIRWSMISSNGVHGVFFTDNRMQRGWAFYNSPEIHILKTTTGGQTWDEQVFPPGKVFYDSIRIWKQFKLATLLDQSSEHFDVFWRDQVSAPRGALGTVRSIGDVGIEGQPPK
jgi:hypothetical protein